MSRPSGDELICFLMVEGSWATSYDGKTAGLPNKYGKKYFLKIAQALNGMRPLYLTHDRN